MSEAMKTVGSKLLLDAFRNREEAQRRVWMASDEVNRIRVLLGQAESILATEERWLGDAQEMLRTVWTDFNPRTGHLTAPSDEPETEPANA